MELLVCNNNGVGSVITALAHKDHSSTSDSCWHMMSKSTITLTQSYLHQSRTPKYFSLLIIWTVELASDCSKDHRFTVLSGASVVPMYNVFSVCATCCSFSSAPILIHVAYKEFASVHGVAHLMSSLLVMIRSQEYHHCFGQRTVHCQHATLCTSSDTI